MDYGLDRRNLHSLWLSCHLLIRVVIVIVIVLDIVVDLQQTSERESMSEVPPRQL
jgi:hypothetical protein